MGIFITDIIYEISDNAVKLSEKRKYHREYNKKYRASERGKKIMRLGQKRYRESEKGKSKIKAYNTSVQGKAKHKRYRQSEKGKQKAKRYRDSEKGKMNREKFLDKYLGSDDHKRDQTRYRESKKGKETLKRYRETGKPREQMKKWRQTAHGKECLKQNYHKRYQNDPQFKVRSLLRNRVRAALKAQNTIKHQDTMGLLGCSIPEFRRHIESQFDEGMSWKNHGVYKNGGPRRWHIDHIRPCRSFNLLDENEQKECFHFTNQQPMWALENIRKSDREPRRTNIARLDNAAIKDYDSSSSSSTSSRKSRNKVYV